MSSGREQAMAMRARLQVGHAFGKAPAPSLGGGCLAACRAWKAQLTEATLPQACLKLASVEPDR
eukprot:3357492-Alexandrium_andersonii.AAC.1